METFPELVLPKNLKIKVVRVKNAMKPNEGHAKITKLSRDSKL